MINKGQEATFAQFLHDGVTYKARYIGAEGNEISVRIIEDATIAEIEFSNIEKAITISVPQKDEEILQEAVEAQEATLTQEAVEAQDAVIDPAINITTVTQQQLLDAYNNASLVIKNIITIEVSDADANLVSLFSSNLVGGQDAIADTIQRGLYAGMSESELIQLRTDLRKALTDITTGKQIISVTIAGKQVTKKLPEFTEVKAELASVNTALQQFNKDKYGKPRRRFMLDHRRRAV